MSEPLTEREDGYDAGVVQVRYLAATLVTLRETLAYIADWAHDRTVAADPDAKDEHGFATVEARCRKALGG